MQWDDGSITQTSGLRVGYGHARGIPASFLGLAEPELGIEPAISCCQTSALVYRTKEDFPVRLITPAYLYLRYNTIASCLLSKFSECPDHLKAIKKVGGERVVIMVRSQILWLDHG
jgi:hypothetical protein